MKHPFTGRYYDEKTEYLTVGLCMGLGSMSLKGRKE